jgi:hypothetical protein
MITLPGMLLFRLRVMFSLLLLYIAVPQLIVPKIIHGTLCGVVASRIKILKTVVRWRDGIGTLQATTVRKHLLHLLPHLVIANR